MREEDDDTRYEVDLDGVIVGAFAKRREACKEAKKLAFQNHGALIKVWDLTTGADVDHYVYGEKR